MKEHHELALATRADMEALQAQLRAEIERVGSHALHIPSKDAE
ncbi:MAG: hypothetical protein OXG37_00940 [Actinomycetia bacterium]|nr:hypothetical protein [Actinomycetes bacterium]